MVSTLIGGSMKFKDFEIRPCDDNSYELVKYHKNASTCFVVAWIIWDEKDEYWEFRSVGLRYLEHHVIGLDEWIIDYLQALSHVLRKDDE
jgi:hypothetical protein